jgi:hypothetical protein
MTTGRSWQQTQFGPTNSRSKGLNFPSPFLDFERFYVPQTIKELFNVTSFAYLTDSNINPAIKNMAAYPITELIYTKPRAVKPKVEDDYKTRWKEIMEERLDVRNFNIMMGEDYHLLGNAFCSVYKPFWRHLVCGHCGEKHNAHRKDTKWKWSNLHFTVHCKKCKTFKDAGVYDELKEDAIEEINLIRWSPFHMRIDANPITGKRAYYYEIPRPR